MLRLDEFQAHVESLFRQNVASIAPDVPIRWPNTLFVPPNDSLFVEWRLLPEQGFAASMGKTQTVRQVGGLQIDVLSPLNSGTRQASTLADRLMRPFAGTQHLVSHGHSVTFREPSSRPGQEANNHERLIVRVAYWRDVRRERDAA